MITFWRLILLIAITWICTIEIRGEDRSSRTPPAESAFFNKNSMINQSRAVSFELGKESVPFIDWAMVECGHVGWSATGRVVPLNDEHDVTDQKDILPVPVAIASGVQLRAQKAKKGKPYDEFIEPTLPWESGLRYTNTLMYDPEVKRYRLWYYNHGDDVMEYFRDSLYRFPPIAYAESEDLENWHKPMLSPIGYGSHQKSNLIYPTNAQERDSWMIKENGSGVRLGYGGAFLIDPAASGEERFKTTFVTSSDREKLEAYAADAHKPLSPMVSEAQANVVYGAVSSDGLGWRVLEKPILLHDADTQTVVHYDEWIKRYVMFTRLFEFGRRTIARSESTDFADFPLPHTVIGTGPTEAPYVDFYDHAVSFYPGTSDIRIAFVNTYDRALDKSVIRLAVSRNGHFWDWIPGEPNMDPDDLQQWGVAWIQVAPSFVPTPHDEMMITYVGTVLPHKFPRHKLQSRLSGVAYWKENRLVALEAPERGEFTTVPLLLRGNTILLNLETERAGQVQVQVLDDRFQKILGRTFEEADLLVGDSVAMPVTWKGESDLSEYRDQVVHLQFRMRAAKLYALKARN